ncbi:MAG: SMC-Scp complex subunit ScpB [Sphingobacteriales bacterium]|nr:SMC-Scp complex subunit ScpB [Sphingobacteriales bacterium]
MEQIQKHIEALIFASEQSIAAADLLTLVNHSLSLTLTEEDMAAQIEAIKEKYTSDDFVFELVEISNGFQFLSKKEYHELLNQLIIHREKKKLSTAAMETLAIIAYKQPITKSEIELIRGVNCDYSVQKLLEKDLIAISGRSSGPGKPILYETSQSFMDHFGLRNQKDLPQLKDIQSFENSINPEDSNLGYETISSEEALEIELREDDTVAEITEESNESSTSENTDTTETATETEE